MINNADHARIFFVDAIIGIVVFGGGGGGGGGGSGIMVVRLFDM